MDLVDLVGCGLGVWAKLVWCGLGLWEEQVQRCLGLLVTLVWSGLGIWAKLGVEPVWCCLGVGG